MPNMCYHCGEPVQIKPVPQSEFAGQLRQFCCKGCLGACQIIHDAGQSSYYELREMPTKTNDSPAQTIWKTRNHFQSYGLPEVLEKITTQDESGLRHLVVQIGGIHCQSCVVLNERLLERVSGVESAVVQYESGRCEIAFLPDKTSIPDILHQIHSIGYTADIIEPGKHLKSIKNEVRGLLWKLALAAFAAGNVMTLSFALWSGYFDGSLSPEFKRLFQWMEFLLTTPVFFYSAKTFHRGWRSFLKTGVPSMDVLISSGISAAYYYSVYSFFVGSGEIYFDSVSMIVFFLLVGRYLEWKARLLQRERMEGLVRPLPQTASVLKAHTHNQTEVLEVAVSNLKSKDIVVLVPGDTLPADGVLLNPQRYTQDTQDFCEVDEAILTGESLPVKRRAGDRMLAGSRVVSSKAFVELNGTIKESGMAALHQLADGAQQSKSRYEEITHTIIPWFSWLIFLVAIVSASLHYFYGSTIEEALIVAVAVLIVSCPCALALAVPTATSAALYAGVKRGVLLKDGQVVQRLSKLRHLFFDKTGTLTCGKPSVLDFVFFKSESQSLQMIYQMESGNYHPVGQSLLEFSQARLHQQIKQDKIEPTYVTGSGVEYTHKRKTWRLGNKDFACNQSENGKLEQFIKNNQESTVSILSCDYNIQAIFALEDRPRAESAKTIRRLRKNKYEVQMLTGDKQSVANHVANQVGIPITHVYADLKPEGKLKWIEKFINNSKTKGDFAMIGDGYNDAPALALADVSIVLARGAPLSLNHADLILLSNNLTDIFTAINISKSAMRTIRFNLTISLLYNVVMVSVAAMGLLLPIWCALAMALSSLSVILSSSLFRVQIQKYKSRISF